MPLLPLANHRGGKLIVRVGGAFRSDIEDRGRAEKLLRRDLVYRRLAGRKMNWRIQMCPVMLQHPEAAREVANLLDGGIDFRLEPPLIAGPRNKFVADGVCEVQDPRLPRENSLEHGLRGAECRVTPRFQPCAESPGTQPR